MTMRWKMEPLGDSAVLIRFEEQINEQLLHHIQQVQHGIETHPFQGWIECIPSYTSLAIHYDLSALFSISFQYQSPYEYIYKILAARLEASSKQNSVATIRNIMDIPVCYGSEFGPDLEAVATYHHLTPDEVIDLHTRGHYIVYALGFAPGFPYLGGMNEQIAMPRHPTPRLRIPAGSVGIAGNQTGIYPIETPGGWRLIGRTPLRLFRPEMQPPTLLQSGDRIRFQPITPEHYAQLLENEHHRVATRQGGHE